MLSSNRIKIRKAS